jgi:serine/threonine protein kinase
VEIDRSTKEDLGTHVAKIGHNAETGQRVLKAYGLARSHLGRHATLSAIFEVAQEWRENDFIALMTWIEGAPLREFTGIFPLLAEEQQESSSEALALRWLRTMCEALDVLHRSGLVHGDISPRNMIVSGSDLVLTDYDFVAKIGERVTAPGTVLYCSPSYQDNRAASPSDDIYALAASFFHVVFEKEPFQYSGAQARERGLNWEGVDRAEYSILAAFLNKATHPDPEQRFGSAADTLAALKASQLIETQTETEKEETKESELGPPSSPDGEKAHKQNGTRNRWNGCYLCCNPIRVRDGGIVRHVASTRISPLKLTLKRTLKKRCIAIFGIDVSGLWSYAGTRVTARLRCSSALPLDLGLASTPLRNAFSKGG